MTIILLLVLFAGLVAGLWPHHAVDRIDARIKAGDDRFHEEQRSYAAYPWLRDLSSVRKRGWWAVIVSLAALALNAMR